MRVSLKAALVAAAMLFGSAAVPSEARTIFHGGEGGGIVAVRDHGHGFGRRGFYGEGQRRHYGGPFVSGGPRYYRHGGYYRDRGFYRHGGYYRDRGFYGRRGSYDRGGPRFYGRPYHPYRDGGVVIRLR